MSERELETVEEVLERLFNGADITDYGRDEVLEALKSSRPLILEEAAKVAEEMFLAPSGLGKYAADWADKPHRVLYDAVNLIRSLSHDGKAPAPEGSAVVPGWRPIESAPKDDDGILGAGFFNGVPWRAIVYWDDDISAYDAEFYWQRIIDAILSEGE